MDGKKLRAQAGERKFLLVIREKNFTVRLLNTGTGTRQGQELPPLEILRSNLI